MANPHNASPQTILQLQRIIGNHAVMRLVKQNSAKNRPPSTKTLTVQRTVKEKQVTEDILGGDFEVSPLSGGLSNGGDTVAYRVKASNKIYVIKVSGSRTELLNAQISKVSGINIPDTIMLPLDTKLKEKLAEKNSKLGESLKEKDEVLIMDYVDSGGENDHIPNVEDNKKRTVHDKYGRIAVNDFLIAKPDLFSEFDNELSPKNLVKTGTKSEENQDVVEIDVDSRLDGGKISEAKNGIIFGSNEVLDANSEFGEVKSNPGQSINNLIQSLLQPNSELLNFVKHNVAQTVKEPYGRTKGELDGLWVQYGMIRQIYKIREVAPQITKEINEARESGKKYNINHLQMLESNLAYFTTLDNETIDKAYDGITNKIKQKQEEEKKQLQNQVVSNVPITNSQQPRVNNPRPQRQQQSNDCCVIL